MARIKIADLPLLQDLTEEQLKELFGAGDKRERRSFDGREDRMLMSVSSLIMDQLPTLSADTEATSAPGGFQVLGQVVLTQQTPGGLTIPGGGVMPQTAPDFAATNAANAAAIGAIFGNPQTTPVLGDPSAGGFVSPQEQGRIAIANKVSSLRSKLGDPLPSFVDSQGFEIAQPTADGGLFRAFQNGSVYWSASEAKFDADHGLNPTTAGARAVMGPIRDTYLGATELGVPRTDTYAMAGGAPGASGDRFC